MTAAEKINTIAIITDIQDQLLTELAPEYRHGMKKLINDASKQVKRLIRYYDKVHEPINQEYFGFQADSLREVIETHLTR